MKGLILAGGRGTRLKELTTVVNKHLLPVWDRPMIHYPLSQVSEAGILECLIVTNPQHVDQMYRLLGDSYRGTKLSYAVQSNPTGGIADAVAVSEGFVRGDDLLVVLGDNLFIPYVDVKPGLPDGNAHIWGKEVEHPEQYGVIEMNGRVVEKPNAPISHLAQTGIYLYPPDVFEKIRSIKPSQRGELEVTDLNNLYADQKRLTVHEYEGDWIDAGTSPEELLKATLLAKEKLDG